MWVPQCAGAKHPNNCVKFSEGAEYFFYLFLHITITKRLKKKLLHSQYCRDLLLCFVNSKNSINVYSTELSRKIATFIWFFLFVKHIVYLLHIVTLSFQFLGLGTEFLTLTISLLHVHFTTLQMQSIFLVILAT